MERVRRQLFECPVCSEIPEGVIYQCKNGHSICKTCSTNVELCPRCDEYLGEPKQRNWTLEAFIAGMEVDCKYKEQGCHLRMPREDLALHVQSYCEFRPALSICKLLGIPNCKFGSQRGDDIYSHFADEHAHEPARVLVAEENVKDAKITLNLTTSLKHLITFRENRMYCCPVDITRVVQGSIKNTFKSRRQRLILCVYANLAQGIYSLVVLDFGPETLPTNGIVTVEIRAPKKDIRWSWSGKPVHYTKVEKALGNPPLKISIPFLMDLFRDQEEELICDLKLSFNDLI